MSNQSLPLLISCALLPSLPVIAGQYPAPPLILSYEYQDDIDPSQFLVSEKLDGIRAYWDGSKLLTRSGNLIHTPDWFTQHLPKTAMDGELWIGRQKFEETSSLLHSNDSQAPLWKKAHFMVFDLPKMNASFERRYDALTNLIKQIDLPHIQAVPQLQVDDQEQLMEKLSQLTQSGAEGLMLHHKQGVYEDKRTHKLLKLKLWQDAEAIVVGYQEGRGQYSGLLGALLVQNNKGERFKIGTGFTQAQRKKPPQIGSLISYKFYGLTKNGKPKFASFLRERRAE